MHTAMYGGREWTRRFHTLLVALASQQLCVHLNIDTLQTSSIRGFDGSSTTQAWLIKSLAIGD